MRQPDLLLLGRTDEFLAEVGVGDGNERFCAFPAASAGEVDRAVFGRDVEHFAAGRCDDVTAELRQNARVAYARLVGEAGAHAQEGKPAFCRRSAVDKIQLTPGAADLACTGALRTDLTVKVRRQAAVDGNDVVDL